MSRTEYYYFAINFVFLAGDLQVSKGLSTSTSDASELAHSADKSSSEPTTICSEWVCEGGPLLPHHEGPMVSLLLAKTTHCSSW